MKNIMTIEDVALEIRRALMVLKALPKVGPQKLHAFWPEYVVNDDDGENMAEDVYYQPFSDEIDDMDIVFEKWLKVLNVEERKLVLCRCEGYGWKKLQHMFKMSRSAIYNRYLRNLKEILHFVSEDQRHQEQGEKNDLL